MNKSTVLNLLGVLRALAPSFAAAGLIVLIGTLLAGVQIRTAFVNPSFALVGVFGYSALVRAAVVALILSLSCSMVARTKFVVPSADRL